MSEHAKRSGGLRPQAEKRVRGRKGEKRRGSPEGSSALLYQRQGTYLAILLEKKLTTIGTGSEMDIQLEGPGISRRHAVIRRSGEEVHLYDFGSATGVRHNGRRVDMARLREGDRVHVGAQEFVYFALTQSIVEKDE